MVEFNADGSLKLPGRMGQKEEENKQRMLNQRCIRVKKEIVNFTAPKKCCLHITLSKAMSDNRFIETIFGDFRNEAKVPSKLNKIDDKEFEVEIGTDFRRCTDCCNLVNRYREFLDGNVIEIKGSCTFERRGFTCEEDYL